MSAKTQRHPTWCKNGIKQIIKKQEKIWIWDSMKPITHIPQRLEE